MELKHLIIAAIVANAAKSGWTEDKRQVAGPDHRNSSGREAVLRGFRHPGRLKIVTSAGDMRPEASAESRVNTRLLRRYLRPVHKVQSVPNHTWVESFGNNACYKLGASQTAFTQSCVAMSVDSPLENTVNANPLRILRAAAPELSGIRVGWRCTTAGLCSNRLYQDASSRPQPPVDSSS